MEPRVIRKMNKKAVDHVDWFLKTIRPLLLSQFKHGYKHGVDDSENDFY